MKNSGEHQPRYRGVPAEMLSEIFLHCVDGAMDAVHTIHTPLLLSRICTRWREAAIATPQLWSRIFLQLSSSDSDAEAQSELVDTWIFRSGACPLTVYIFWEDPPFSVYHPVLESLTLHCQRWKTMFFYMPISAFKSMARVRGKLPLLTELSLGSGDDPTAPINFTIDIFEITPKLCSLECVNCSPFIFSFPWAQLSEIPVMAVAIDDCLGILRRSTQLEKAGFVFLTGGLTSSPTPVQHTNLRHFTVMTPPWNETVDLSQLFPHLTLPKLEHLTICNLKSPFGSDFIPFLSRLQSLQTLHLRKTSFSDAELVRGLAAVPSLIALILHSSPQGESAVTDHLMTALTWKCRTTEGYLIPSLVPSLKKLELQVDNDIAQSFVNMVKSRRVVPCDDSGSPIISALEQARVRVTGELEEHIIDQLEVLREDGLSVEIEHILPH